MPLNSLSICRWRRWVARPQVARLTASHLAALELGLDQSAEIARDPVRRVFGEAGEVEDGLAALVRVRLAIDKLDAIAGRLARETGVP